MPESYTDFAAIYDRLILEDIDYTAIADYIEATLSRLGKKAELVCDLACGTGTLTDILAKRGYDMIGIDLSTEMLDIARRKNPDILFLNQDICEFELYGTVDALLCMTDSLNYIPEASDLLAIFKAAKTCYLNPDAPFIFDLNSPYKLKSVLGDNTFTYDSDDVFYVWENEYSPEEKCTDFYLTFFVKEGEAYRRFSETHTEYVYSQAKITALLKKAGFTKIEVFDGYTNAPAHKFSERLVFVAR